MHWVTTLYSGDGLTGEYISFPQGNWGRELFGEVVPRSISATPGTVMEVTFNSGQQVLFAGAIELGDRGADVISVRKTTEFPSSASRGNGVIQLQLDNIAVLRDALISSRDRFRKTRTSLVELNNEIREINSTIRSTFDRHERLEWQAVRELMKVQRGELKA